MACNEVDHQVTGTQQKISIENYIKNLVIIIFSNVIRTYRAVCTCSQLIFKQFLRRRTHLLRLVLSSSLERERQRETERQRRKWYLKTPSLFGKQNNLVNFLFYAVFYKSFCAFNVLFLIFNTFRKKVGRY